MAPVVSPRAALSAPSPLALAPTTDSSTNSSVSVTVPLSHAHTASLTLALATPTQLQLGPTPGPGVGTGESGMLGAGMVRGSLTKILLEREGERDAQQKGEPAATDGPGLPLAPHLSQRAAAVTRSHVVLRRMEAELALPWREDQAAVEEAEIQAETEAMARALEEAEEAEAEAAAAVVHSADGSGPPLVVEPPPPTPEEQAELDKLAEWKRQREELAASRIVVPVGEASAAWHKALSSAFAAKIAEEEAAIGDGIVSADVRVPAIVSRHWWTETNEKK